MPRLLFDISDIVQFAQQSSRVSGIQRVQLGLLRNISEFGDRAAVAGVFFEKSASTLREFELGDFLPNVEYHGKVLLRRLGLIRSAGRMPDRYQVRKYLREFRSNKIRRLWKQMDLYMSALFFDKRFARTGLIRARDECPGIVPIKLASRNSLQRHEVLVFLGGNWSIPGSIEFARRHRGAGGRVVQFVHDLIPHYFPEYVTEGMARDFKEWLCQLDTYVTDVICISRCTARDFLRLGLQGFSESNVKVVPLAHEMMGYPRNYRVPDDERQMREETGDEFVLAVGTIEVRKNAVSLLKAWLKLIQEDPEKTPRLVFAGKRGWRTEEFDRILQENPELLRWVLIIDSPSDAVLVELYSACLFTVFVSHYEGWGLPVGESVWMGKYCLASSASSVPEVCGEMLDYVDPDDFEAIFAWLRKALIDRGYLASKERALAGIPLRMWSDVASDVCHAINSSISQVPVC